MSFYYRNTATGAAVQSSIELDQPDLVEITEEEHQLLVNPPPTEQPELTQFEKDELRYQKRAEVKDKLLAYMAADNMSRVRSGVWSVSDLTSLMDDPFVKEAQSYMAALSFELVIGLIQGATTELLTTEIKEDWISKLQAHLYLTP